jgi:hypothetical protein
LKRLGDVLLYKQKRLPAFPGVTIEVESNMTGAVRNHGVMHILLLSRSPLW